MKREKLSTSELELLVQAETFSHKEKCVRLIKANGLWWLWISFRCQQIDYLEMLEQNAGRGRFWKPPV
jgi:hypothetical protein